MTVKAKGHNGTDHSTAIKAAELELSVAAGRIATADQDCADAKVIRDQLIAELESGNEEVSATELAAGHAAVLRGEALAVGARTRHQAAEDQLVAAVLDATVQAAGQVAVEAPAALAELRAARAKAKAATDQVLELETRYATRAREMGRSLQIAGAPRMTPGDLGTGWCGRDGGTGVIYGFTAGQVAVVDYQLG